MTDAVERLSFALSEHRLERELGQGGMATVYLAHDLKHDRRVALKVLRPELAAAIGADRFLAEIRTTANLQHPRPAFLRCLRLVESAFARRRDYLRSGAGSDGELFPPRRARVDGADEGCGGCGEPVSCSPDHFVEQVKGAN